MSNFRERNSLLRSYVYLSVLGKASNLAAPQMMDVDL